MTPAETLAAVRALLEELGALEAKATKGPWRARRNSQRPYMHVEFDRDEMYTTSPLNAADARLIVALRNALPRLRALVGEG